MLIVIKKVFLMLLSAVSLGVISSSPFLAVKVGQVLQTMPFLKNYFLVLEGSFLFFMAQLGLAVLVFSAYRMSLRFEAGV